MSQTKTKRARVRDLVETYLTYHHSDAWATVPDPRDSPRKFAAHCIESGELGEDTPPLQSFARYVRWALQEREEGTDLGDGEDEQGSVLVYNRTRSIYDEVQDLYSFWPPGKTRSFVIAGEDIRAMKRMYSNDGEKATINQVCKAFGMSRKDFHFVKRELRWTHDEDEYTDEEHHVCTTKELLEDRAMRSRRRLEKAAAKVKWETDARDAERWRNWKRHTIEALADSVMIGPSPVLFARDERLIGVISPSDLHIGKIGVHGYSIDEARRAVLDTTARLLADLELYEVDALYLVLGNDWGHIDNPMGGTTRGTPQDSHLYREVVRASVSIARDLIELCREGCLPLTVNVIPSNHSKAGDFWMVEVLAALYEEADDITISRSTQERQYVRFGKTLLGFEHGDGAKATDLPLIMAKERAADWGQTTHRYWMTGHLHHLHEKDHGVVILQAPSLSGTDRWHDKNGYVLSTRQNVAWVFGADGGNPARFLAAWPPTEPLTR